MTFKPPGLSFLISEVGIVVYLSYGHVTSSYFASCLMIHLNKATWPPLGIWQCLRTFLLSQLGRRVLWGCRGRDAAKHAPMHRTAPEQRTTWSDMSVLPWKSWSKSACNKIDYSTASTWALGALSSHQCYHLLCDPCGHIPAHRRCPVFIVGKLPESVVAQVDGGGKFAVW